MTLKKPGRQAARERVPSEHWTPGEAMQFDAVVSACALVASADGCVTPDERRRALDRMRRLHAVSIFGVEEALEAFETLIARIDRDCVDGVEIAETAVRRLKGRRGPSFLLIEATCDVAASDGSFDPEERATVLRLCALLDVEPDAFRLFETQLA